MKITCEKCNKDYDIRIRRNPRKGFCDIVCPWCNYTFILEFFKIKQS